MKLDVFLNHRPLSKTYEAVAKSVFEASLSSQTGSRKRAHDDLQEKASALISNVKLFEKGILVFPGNSKFISFILKRGDSQVLIDI